ncbi:MAG TPA: hypothetical protein VLA88_06630 [Candidatus Saccharimonadales bacterium]|nr:hypothetical protein [Candidatus Saccharimonadales bacterium]
MANVKQGIASFFVVVGVVVATAFVPAATVSARAQACTGDLASFLGLKSWDACIAKDGNGVPQLDDITDIWHVGIVIIEDLVKIGGYLAVGYFIWGGFKYVKSQGEPGETAQARTIINNALLGLVIVLISVSIIQFIAGTFT